MHIVKHVYIYIYIPLCPIRGRYHQRFLKPVQAWEPVEVCMLFTGETELEAQEVPMGWMRPGRG